MGVKGITGLALRYFTDVLKNKCQFIKSDTYYMDYTSKIFLTVRWFIKQLRLETVDPNKLTIEYYNQCIEELLELISDEIVDHINNHRFYKKYIIVFDYLSGEPPIYQLNDKSYNDIVNKFNIKEQKSSVVMVNRQIIDFIENQLASKEVNDGHKNVVETFDEEELIDLLISMSKTMVNTVWHYWASDNDIRKYIRLSKLRDDGLISEKVYNAVIKHHTNEFILTRCLKKKSLKSNYEEGWKKIALTTSRDEIKHEINKLLFNIRPPMIVALVPNIIHRIKQKLAERKLDYLYIEFLGCCTEADHVIKKHIKMYSPTYNQNNNPNHRSLFKPTIFTIDTDMLVLLSNIDCVVNLKLRAPGYTNKTVPIQVKEFWKWALHKDNYTYDDVLKLVDEKNSTYRYPNSLTRIYENSDELEPNFYFIEDCDNVDFDYIHHTNSNVLTKLYLNC